MAHALSVTDGTTTISLTSTNFMLLRYVPVAPRMVEGEDIELNRVTESIDVLAYAGSTTDMQDAVRAVEQLFTTARRRAASNTGPRVFIQLQLSGDSDTYRSEITDGYIQLGDESLQAWGNAKMTCAILIERRVYWEGARTLLVDAETIVNGEGGNSVSISSSSVEGALPAPVEVKITNGELGAVTWRNWYMAGNAFNDPATFSPWLTGSAFVWSNNQTHGTSILAWTLTDAQLADMAGDYFRFIAGYTTAPTADAYAKLRLRWNNQVTLVEGDEVYTGASGGHYLEDMGAFPVPPGGASSATLVSVRYSVRAEASGSGTLDFIAMFPADNFRKIRQVDYSTAAGASIIDDGIEGIAYVDVSGSRYPLVATYGDPLRVWPGRTNVLYFLYDEAAGFSPTNSMDVSVWYRPRRLTV